MHLIALLNFTNLVATAGYSAIFALCLLQSCCVPTSSELTMGFAGVLAAQGKLSIAGVIAVGVLGEVVGAYIAWAVGRYAGRAAVDRFGRYILLSHRDLDRAEAWYDRHQRFGVLGSRLLPVIRNFVALPAGIAEVPLVRFGVLTAVGSLLWDGAWAGIGFGVGSHWHAIAKGVGDIGYVLGVIAVGAIVYAGYHRYRSYKEGNAEDHDPRSSSDAAGLSAAPERSVRAQRAPQTGSVRWLASSSGQPPVRSFPERTEPVPVRQIIGPAGPPPARARRTSDFPDSPIAAWEAAVRRGAREPARRTGRRRARDGTVGASSDDDHPPSPARRYDTRPGSDDHSAVAAGGQLPLVGRIFPAPIAAKVPEVILVFWVVKILTTAGGEATSDYLRIYGNLKGGAIEVGLFVVGLLVQFGSRRYRAFSYWFLAFAIAIFGTGVSDFLHLDVGIPYAGTTLLWAVVLAVILWWWHHREGTLSIHTVTTQRREAFYWSTVFATFALGTALGDFTAASLHLGYLASGIVFGVVIFIPALAWWKLRLDAVAAFWMSYVVTRPLGASFADYISKPHSLSGVDFGDGQTAVVFALAVLVLVSYLAVSRADVQRPRPVRARTARSYSTVPLHAARTSLEPD